MAGKPDRVVFIDTTEVIAKGKSAVFAADLRRLSQTSRVVTSTLVLDELEAGYRKDRREVETSYGYYFPADRLPDPQALRVEFERHLTNAGVAILPVTVTVADVTRADLQGGQPFKKEGAGYRDFINWATFVDCVNATGVPGSFLTSNSKDFGDGGKVSDALIAAAKVRGCTAELETLRSDEFMKRARQPLPQPAPPTPAVTQEQLDRALTGWLSIVEDGEILQALRVPGPGPGIELVVTGVRDKSAELLRGPEAGAVQMVFRATFDCKVSFSFPNSFGIINPKAVRLEWTVEADFDERRGIISVPHQIAAMRVLDAAPAPSN